MPFLLAAIAFFTVRPSVPAPMPIWCPKGIADEPDSHVAFRGVFRSPTGRFDLKLLGASEYLVWLDGKLIEDGPARFPKSHPEYQSLSISTQPGQHLLAVHVHKDGVTTRMLSQMAPFLWCGVSEGADTDSISWRCARIPGYRAGTRRISDILGWIDWCDTGQIWPHWQDQAFDDSRWLLPVPVDPGLGPVIEARTKPVRLISHSIRPIAQGRLTENFGYELDDPAVRFFLRDLDPGSTPSQGVWRRYDLGRVRLGRPRFKLDLPKGAVVEFAYCEQLGHSRVHPWITLSGSQTCNFDHFVAAGGPQEFMPFTPKGGRFLEIHVLSKASVKFLDEQFLERTYYGEPEGSFQCDDPLLNRIWKTGVETFRACSDDSPVDCPTRERGEWTGDVASVATDIGAVAYSDLSLSRRALVQAAQSARSDGLVAGVGPGDPGYLSTYAAQWVTACVHYWRLSGDRSLLQELLPSAERNIAAFQAKTTKDGVSGDLGWGFIDWGYVPNEGPSDIALDIHYLIALRAMADWETALGFPAKSAEYVRDAEALQATVKAWLSHAGGWEKVGYHRAALALLAGLVPKAEEAACIAAIESHLRTCFPNDPRAPRLSDPGVSGDRFMTPYFCHFAFTALLDHGETEFVLGQYRKCWGWALGEGRTTCLEVFDTRWSHCHEWSGCPTWQLSRYILGLRPRFDLGSGVYDLKIQPGSLRRASGDIPTPDGSAIRVSWTATSTRIRVRIEAAHPIRLRIDNREVAVSHTYEGELSR
jgi:hypothetical protein